MREKEITCQNINGRYYDRYGRILIDATDILTNTIDILKISSGTEWYFQILISNWYAPIYRTDSDWYWFMSANTNQARLLFQIMVSYIRDKQKFLKTKAFFFFFYSPERAVLWCGSSTQGIR